MKAVAGTVGAVASAVGFLPWGGLVVGPLLITLFVLTVSLLARVLLLRNKTQHD